MNKSPLTRKDIQQPSHNLGQEKYRDVRKRVACVQKLAKDDYVNRKARRDKTTVEKVPKFAVGKKLIAVIQSWKKERNYLLCEVVDFDISRSWGGSRFYYYCMVLKVTRKEDRERIGRLCHLSEDSAMKEDPKIKIYWLDD